MILLNEIIRMDLLMSNYPHKDLENASDERIMRDYTILQCLRKKMYGGAEDSCKGEVPQGDKQWLKKKSL